MYIRFNDDRSAYSKFDPEICRDAKTDQRLLLKSIGNSTRCQKKQYLFAKVTFCLIAALVMISGNLSRPGCLAQSADPVVRIDTSKGPIFIRVFQSMVPTTANNFLDLVSRGFYSGKYFHRIETWCIQGGDQNGDGSTVFVDPETGVPRFIPLEINRNLRHTSAGVVAMARSSGPNTGSCQFYILKQPMAQLDGKYAVFGRVVGGINSVYAMRRGDTILSAQLLPPESPPQPNQPTNQPDTTKARTNKSKGPPPAYEPPKVIEDSGF